MAHILVADDDPHILMLSSLIFQEAGHTLIPANDGEEAIEKILIHKPDVVLSDIIMPKKGGFELCKTLKANPDLQDIPVILISAIRDSLYQKNSEQAGANAYIEKPFDVNDLNETVEQVMKGQLNPAQNTDSKNESDTEAFSFKHLPSPSFQSIIREDSALLLKGKKGTGKMLFAKSIAKNYFEYAAGQVIWINFNSSPRRLLEQLRHSFGNHIESLCAKNRLVILNASPSTEYNQEKWVLPIPNRYDLNYILNQINQAKSLYLPLYQAKKTCICLDTLTPFDTKHQPDKLFSFVQLLTQSEDLCSQDLCMILEEYENMPSITALNCLTDQEIHFRKSNGIFELKVLEDNQLGQSWQNCQNFMVPNNE